MKAIITVGYGAGLSDWNDPKLAIDQRVVEAFEKNPKMSVDEFKALCESCGYDDVFIIKEDLEIMEVVEVPDDVYFRIISYDGWEQVEIFDPDKWFHS